MNILPVLPSSQYEENKIIQQLVGNDGSHVFLSNLPADHFIDDAPKLKYYSSKESLVLLDKFSFYKGINLDNRKHQVSNFALTC